MIKIESLAYNKTDVAFNPNMGRYYLHPYFIVDRFGEGSKSKTRLITTLKHDRPNSSLSLEYIIIESLGQMGEIKLLKQFIKDGLKFEIIDDKD